MNLTIVPRMLHGSLKIPSSKSAGHRLTIAAALAGRGRVGNLSLSADILATLNGMKALGSDYCVQGDCAVFEGRREVAGDAVVIDCNESGSTLRFLIPIAIALFPDKRLVFKGKGRLLERPLEPYFDLFREKGVRYRREPDSLTIKGTLTNGAFPLSGKVSSQFITGLLFALPLLKGDSQIVITDSLESKGYVDMTLEALQRSGIVVENKGYREFWVSGGQKYMPCDIAVEGDYSQAAFFYTADFIGSSVVLHGLNPHSCQGDRAVLSILKDFGQSGECVLDVSDIPDLAPTLAVAAAYRAGEVTRLINASRLRMKESDRILTTCLMLRRLGAKVEEGIDSITIWGQETLPGTEGEPLDCCNDHRIAMAAAAAAVGCKGKVRLLGAECVQKSYPAFWDDYRLLGGEVIEEDGR